MNILFIDTAHSFLIDSLRGDGHRCIEAYDWSREKVLLEIGNVQGIVIRSRIVIDRQFLDAAIDLKFIARAGAGMESIDLEYAGQKNIKCLNSPEGNRDAVAEHAIGMLLSLFNNLIRADREIRNGEWIRERNRGVELNGKTVGIIGYGNMGRTFAKRLKGFDCKILVYDKYLKSIRDSHIEQVEMNRLFEEADVLSLHVPLTDETTYLVDDIFINRFEKAFYLINTARGKCVRIADVVKNIKSGKIKGACFDVFEYEDLSFEKFSIELAGLTSNPDWQYLIQSDQVMLSPHIAGWTHESLKKIAEVLYSKIKAL